MNQVPCYFLSDAHLGEASSGFSKEREGKLVGLLESWTGKAACLVLVGDLFEFWMEYREYIPKAHFAVLAALHRLAEGGTEIHYVAGNHDFNLGNFFDNHLNIRTYPRECILELQGHRILCMHGDGLAASDWKYRFARKVITHPLSNLLFRQIHPDWGMALAKRVGRFSRSAGSGKLVPREEYREAAAKLMTQHSCNVFIQGHTHQARMEKMPKGLRINCGEWFQNLQYIRLQNGEFEICSWQN